MESKEKVEEMTEAPAVQPESASSLSNEESTRDEPPEPAPSGQTIASDASINQFEDDFVRLASAKESYA